MIEPSGSKDPETAIAAPGLRLGRRTLHLTSRTAYPGIRPVSPLLNSYAGRLVKNDERQGARILTNEAYMQYAAMTKDEAERSRSRFSPACYTWIIGACGIARIPSKPGGKISCAL